MRPQHLTFSRGKSSYAFLMLYASSPHSFKKHATTASNSSSEFFRTLFFHIPLLFRKVRAAPGCPVKSVSLSHFDSVFILVLPVCNSRCLLWPFQSVPPSLFLQLLPVGICETGFLGFSATKHIQFEYQNCIIHVVIDQSRNNLAAL